MVPQGCVACEADMQNMNTQRERTVSLLDPTVMMSAVITIDLVRLVLRPRKRNFLLLLGGERPAGKHDLHVNTQLQLWSNEESGEGSQRMQAANREDSVLY